MRKVRLIIFSFLLLGLLPCGPVFAHGDEGATDTLHPPTEIGLPDAKAGHQHGGAMNMSAAFDAAIDPPGPYAVGATQALHFTITDSASGHQIKDFELTQTKHLHVIIISSDLQEFYHLHPELESDGTFLLKENFSFPRDMGYTVFLDLAPKGAGDILLRKDVAAGSGERVEANLSPSQFPVTTDGVRMDLVTDPQTLAVAANTTLTFHLADESGKPIDDIEPYLGTSAHLVLVSDSFNYLHVHPLGTFPTDSLQLASMRFGPTLAFNTTFPTADTFKGWLQFQRQGKITAVPFVAEVKKGGALTRADVQALVQDEQKAANTQAAFKFMLLAFFVAGIILLFYQDRQKTNSTQPPVSDTNPAMPTAQASPDTPTKST